MPSEPVRQIALVTGASRGIGAAIARLLAERGAAVAINYRSKGSRAESAVARIQAVGRRAILAQADPTSPADLRAMAQTIAEAALPPDSYPQPSLAQPNKTRFQAGRTSRACLKPRT
ncbi:MAG: SDR family NAD(P)-dependent oxidoreductase [Chloroflexales bacterium]